MASRYVKPKRNFISILTLLSMIGPAIGVAVLITVIAVMTGFDHDIKAGILTMQPHFTARSYISKFKNPEKLIEKVNAIDGLKASAIIDGPVLLQSNHDISPQMLIGIIPEYENDVTELESHIIRGSYDLKDNEVLIGNRMALSHGLDVGSKIVIQSLATLQDNIDFSGGEIKMIENPSFDLPTELTVVGIFSVGVFQFDSGIIVSNLDTADDLFDEEWGTASEIRIKTPDAFELDHYFDPLEEILGLSSIRSWQQNNRRLFGTVKMEKNMMFFLLFFIVLIAAFNISATLLTFAIQKRREVGVMKALGATPIQIMRIFLVIGLSIGTISTTIGTILGIQIVEHREQVLKLLTMLKGDDAFPADLYQLAEVPGKIIPSDLIIIFVGSLFLCVVAAVVPAIFAAYSNPAKALKSEELL